MALATRVIPTLLCRGRSLVKGERFNAWRSVGVAAQAVRIHQAREVDEICLLDITATAEGRGPDLELIEELAEVVFSPLSVGGGVRSIKDVHDLLHAGADKIVIGTAVTHDGLIRRITDKVGNQAIVCAVDIVGGQPAVRCGKEVLDASNPVGFAQFCEAQGAGEILLTSIDREGTMRGYDLDLIRSVSAAVSIPVIAHGGAGTYEHMRQAIEAGAHAVAAGALFQFTDSTPRGAAQYLSKHGIEVRL